MSDKSISKFLSFILRHKPDAIALELDEQGWANIDELISKANQSGEITDLDRVLIQKIVDTNDKQRFIISDDEQHIRANQGHSININLQLKPITPPEFLYHGTASRFLDSILKKGINSQDRQHVHLSENIDTASSVGKRYGKPIVLTIKTLQMHKDGIVFYQSENKVWLVNSVPSKYIIH